MPSIVKPGIVLLIIGAIAAALLGYVSEITKEPIAVQEKLTEDSAKQKVLDGATVFEEQEIGQENGNIKALSLGYSDESKSELLGYTVNVVSKGYGGEISLMVGLDVDGVLTGIDIISHSETPGLGANASNPTFSDQYKGKSGTLTVTKNAPNENEIQAITSATITSRAVTAGVNEVIDFYSQNLAG